MGLTPDERVSRATRAALASWEQTPDPTARTEPARAAAQRRFVDQVDPDRTLPDAERALRAGEAMSDFYRDLAQKSLAARRARRARRQMSGAQR